MSGRILFVFVWVICGACQSNPPSLVSRYASDAEVQERLHQLDVAGFKVEVFSSEFREFGQDTCRGRPIRLPRGETMAEYVRSAIETEITRAALFDPEAPLFIYGTVRRVELKTDGRVMSGAIGATWLIDVEFHSSNGRSLLARAGHAYRTGFQTVSCAEAAKALMPTVQKLVRNAVANPNFARLLENKS